jgi:xylulokinase
MADASGLAAGTPVVAGCGDTAASFLSCGATREGVCVDVAGTASVFAATTTEYRADTEALVLGCGQAVVKGLWHPYAYINGGGMNLEWFRTLVTGMVPEASAVDLEALNALAAEERDPDSLPYFVPHFGGRVTPPMPHLRGAWVGLDWSHGIGSLYRSMLESVALEYGVYRDVLLSLYPEFSPRELRVTGGGEKSAVWNQIKADVLAVPVVSVGGGGAPMGSAMLAAHATGVFTDLTGASDQWVRPGASVEPTVQMRETYEKRAKKYAELLDLIDGFLNT